MLKRIVTAAVAAVLALAASAPAVYAQKALVYCPVGIDASGCDRIVTALQSTFTGGVDRGYDGSNGTVDLTKIDLHHYGVFVVPSLADDATMQPYALLHSVASRLHFAITGRVAVYSGAPDQGNSNRSDKDALINNLATWAANGHSRATGLVGLVAFLDLSEHVSDRYSWVRDISLTDVSADAQLTAFGDVQAVSPRGTSVLSAAGRSVRFSNMASYGLHIGRRAAARTEIGALGGSTGAQSVLVMYSNADGKDGGTAGGSAGTGKVGATGASLDVTGAKATFSTTSSTTSTATTSGPTITTDKPDYLPGDTVTFTGTGFAAGDTVTITVHEDPTWSFPDRQFVSVADANGAFTNRDMVVATQDFGVTFTATAVGNPSGLVAQTTFTDGNSSVSGTVTDAITNAPLSGVSVTCDATTGCNATITVTTDPTGNYSFSGGNKLSFATNGPVTIALKFAKAGYVTGSLTLNNVNNSSTFTNQNVALTPAGPTKLAFTSSAVSGAVGACLGPITIQTQNASDAPTNVTSATTVNLTTDNGTSGTAAFYDSNACSSAITNLVIANGSNSGTLYYRATARGSGAHLLTAAASGLTSATQTETINKATPVFSNLTASQSVVYGTASVSVSGKLTSPTLTPTGTVSVTLGTGGGADIQSATLAVDGSFSASFNTNTLIVGSSPYTIAYSFASTNDFDAASDNTTSLTITPKALTITASDRSKTYGDAVTFAGTEFTSSGLINSDAVSSVTLTSAGAAATASVSGSPYDVTPSVATGTGLSNYTITYAVGQLTVSPKALTITANDLTKTYGDAVTFAGTEFTSSGLVNSETIGSVTLTSTGAAATASVSGSPYLITPSAAVGGAFTAGNYSITYTDGHLTISRKAASVTAVAASKVYGDPDPALSTTNNGFLAGDLGTGKITFSASRTAGETVAGSPYAITPAASDNGSGLLSNYTVTTNTANFTITPRAASITPNAADKTYGDADPTLTGTLSGFVAGDNVTATCTRTAGETVAGSPYTISATLSPTGVLANYTITYNTAIFTIKKRAASVTPDAKSKVYGDPDPVLTGTLTGFLAADGVTATYSRTAGETVAGSPYTISATLSPVGVLSNYSITKNTANFIINTKAASITASAASKNYGDPDPVFTGTFNGFLASDNVTVSFARAPTGEVPSANNNLSSASYSVIGTPNAPASVLANYSITNTSASFTITNDTPTITGLVGPGGPVALGSQVTVTGTFSDRGYSGDVYTISSTWIDGGSSLSVPTVGAATYNGNTGTFTIIAPSNTPAGVYTVTVKVTDRWNVTSAAATVTGYVVVYDPSGGFVTGGGWITAQDGSCIQSNAPTGVCTNATGGRANFGFVSKYQKGANVPSGNTEFQFQGGNLNFKSANYQWLVISGPQAQFKGTGTINGGSAVYSFILTAWDGQVSGAGGTDKFRIKIMDANGNVVFDNQLGDADSAAPNTALGGGSIQIQSK